jgi:hypothetical protein
MKKQERNEVYMFYFVCRTFHCKDMTPLILGDFDKKRFFTQLAVVQVHC